MSRRVPVSVRSRGVLRPGGSARAARLLVLLAGVALALAGCRLDVDTRVELTPAGSGTLVLTLDLDQELVQALTVTGFDPTPDPVSGWEVERIPTEAGEQVRMSSTFDDPGQLSDRVDDLNDGLGEEDPRLVESIELLVQPDGTTSLEAEVGLRLPSSTGLEGPGFAGAEDLAALAADPDIFRATFTVVVPGPILDHNADLARGATAVWELEPGEELLAQVSSGPPALVGGWVLTAIAVGALLVVVGLGVWLLRRRRRERRAAPLGRVLR